MISAGLRFERVTKTFATHSGPVWALDGVTLDVEPGSFTAVVGPSGCGKSTLLHIAAGLDTRYGGRFRKTPEEAVSGVLFQTPRLLQWLSVERNVAFVLETRGWTKRAARDRAMTMLDIVGLGAFAKKFPSQLSGGMQQRVALARALAVDPACLLMDEPFSALDELTARELREELVDLHSKGERTILFITHHIYEACFLSDRIIVLSAGPGRVVADIGIAVSRPRRYDDPRLTELAAEVLSHIERRNRDLEGSKS